MYWRAMCAVAVLLVIGGGSASASTSQTQHFNGRGAFADWFRPITDTSGVFATVGVSQTKSGNEQLSADFSRFDTHGEVDWFVSVTHGFTMSVDSKDFTTASVNGTWSRLSRSTTSTLIKQEGEEKHMATYLSLEAMKALVR